MAKLRVRSGDAEVEIDSRDFYVDNDTVGDVIDLISSHLPSIATEAPQALAGSDVLDSLDEAEVHEAEFTDPKPIKPSEIRYKIRTLQDSTFFDEPRTAFETVEQLREHGWIANLLDVSKELASMSAERMIRVDSRDRRNYYSVLLVN